MTALPPLSEKPLRVDLRRSRVAGRPTAFGHERSFFITA